MKYIDPETNCIMTTEEVKKFVLDNYCAAACKGCPLKGKGCYELMHTDRDKLARCIGLIPYIKICAILGVSIGERFTIRGFNPSVVFEVQENGQYKTTPEHVTGSGYALIDAINNPELVEKRAMLTAEEIELCRSLGVKYLYRGTEGIEASCVSMWKSRPDPPCVFPIGEWQTSFIGCLRNVDFKSIGCGMLFEVED